MVVSIQWWINATTFDLRVTTFTCNTYYNTLCCFYCLFGRSNMLCRLRRFVGVLLKRFIASLFGWLASLVWYLLLNLLISSRTVGIVRSFWIISFVTNQSAPEINLNTFDWKRCSMSIFVLLADPHSCIPYVQMSLNIKNNYIGGLKIRCFFFPKKLIFRK